MNTPFFPTPSAPSVFEWSMTILYTSALLLSMASSIAVLGRPSDVRFNDVFGSCVSVRPLSETIVSDEPR